MYTNSAIKKIMFCGLDSETGYDYTYLLCNLL